MGYGDTKHVPVMAEEIIGLIGVRAEGYYCDATVGGGGFAQQLIDRLAGGKLVCLDMDAGAIENLRGRWEGDPRVELVRSNFCRLAEVWSAGGWPNPDGIVYDLGLSSIQLDDPARGLSFQTDSQLDMRLDRQEETPTAAEIVNTWDVMDLSRLFWRHGEMAGGRIARRLVKEREVSAIETTGRLAAIVSAAAGKKKSARHPATKVFLAFRMAVNHEEERLRDSLKQALKLVAVGGKIAVISWQGVEDGIVKDIFRRAAKGCSCELPPDECFCNGKPEVKYLHKGVVTPSLEEVEANPRARSAKLRVIERI